MAYIYLENDAEYVSIKSTEFNDVFGIKNLEFEKKISFLKQALKDSGLRNVNLIINISLLLKRFNDFDDSLFERDDIYFNSLIELVDAKLELQSELDDLRKSIVKYYLSVIKSLVVKNEEQSKDMDNLYFLLLRILSVYDISLMLQKIDISGIEPEFVRCANIIYQDMLKNE